MLYPAKTSFRNKGQIKNFPDKKKLKEFIIIKPLLYGTIFFRDLFKKKKKVKTLNNKMVINTYHSTFESKEQTQTSTDRIMGMESILRFARWEGGVAERMKR